MAKRETTTTTASEEVTENANGNGTIETETAIEEGESTQSASSISASAFELTTTDAGLEAFVEWSDSTEFVRQNRIFPLLPEDINVDHRSNGRRKKRSAGDKDVKELAASIEQQGRVIEPVIGYFDSETHAPILGIGFGRYEAVKLINATRDDDRDKMRLPVIFLDINKDGAFVLNVAENLKRHNLNAMDIADNIQRMKKEHGFNGRQCAEAMGMSEPSITGYTKLLAFPEFIQEGITDGLLTSRSAMELTKLSKDPVMLEKVAKGLIEKAREGDGTIKAGAVRKAVKKHAPEPSTQLSAKELREALEGATGPGENARVSAVCSIIVALHMGKSFNGSGKISTSNLTKKLEAAVLLPLKGSKAA